MNDPIFLTIAQLAARYPIAKTKIYQLIGDRTLITGKIGRRTVILTSSVREFTAAALRLGNLGEVGAERFFQEQKTRLPALCNIHSSPPADQASTPSDTFHANNLATAAVSPEKNFGENDHG